MFAKFDQIAAWLRLNPIIYRLIRVEYIRFGGSNEYLISLYQLRWPLLKRFQFETITQGAIGLDPYGKYFANKVRKLQQKGIQVSLCPEMTLEEFTTFARDHPILYKDRFVRFRLAAHAAGINHLTTTR